MFEEIIVKLEYLTKAVEELKKQVKFKTKDVTLVAKDDIKMLKLKCSRCFENFDSKKKLNLHMRKCHEPQFPCRLCEYEGQQISDLDEHIVSTHPNGEMFRCNECGNKFLSEARMKMHKKTHVQYSKTKICHYFNNMKLCPYERFGRKFKHSDSKFCRDGQMCEKKLCQSKHSQNGNSKGDRIIPKARDEAEKLKVDEDVRSISLALEQYEARDIYCDNYCSKEENIHTHTSNTFKIYRGVSDIESTNNIECEICEHKSRDLIDHENHFEKKHNDEEVTVSCVFPKCAFEANVPEDLIEHFAAVHDKWIQKSL